MAKQANQPASELTAKLPAVAQLPDAVPAKATVLKVATDNTTAYITVGVDEDTGPAEYVASIPLSVLTGRTPAEVRQTVRAVVVAERAARLEQKANLDQYVGSTFDL